MVETSRQDMKRANGFQVSAGQLVALLPDPDAGELAETLVAFSNADGGVIYLGVDEDGQVTGQVFPEDFTALVEQAERQCRPPVMVEWQQLEIDGRFTYVGRIQRGPELHVLADGRVVIRTGAENRELSRAEVQQIVAARSFGDYEAEPVPGAGRSDLDDVVLEEFMRVWEERQGRPLTRPIEDLLCDMGWLLPDGRPTVAGLLLFGRNPTTFLPRCGVTFVRFTGEHVRRGEDGAGYGRRAEVTGPLAYVIQRVYEIVQEEIHLGAVVRGLQRQEQWVYPPTAVREALVNAVAHRDYRLQGRAIEVRMFSDRMEISSPGGLPGYITLDNIVEEHFSRNPRIVSGLFQWGYIEELGMGVDLMIEEMVAAGHPPPEFRASEASFTVVFRSVRQRRPMPQGLENLTLNERQARALAYIQQHQRIRSRDYQDLCPDVSPETLRLDLADLVERGILLKIGRKRGTYYILK